MDQSLVSWIRGDWPIAKYVGYVPGIGEKDVIIMLEQLLLIARAETKRGEQLAELGKFYRSAGLQVGISAQPHVNM